MCSVEGMWGDVAEYDQEKEPRQTANTRYDGRDIHEPEDANHIGVGESLLDDKENESTVRLLVVRDCHRSLESKLTRRGRREASHSYFLVSQPDYFASSLTTK